ncbi:MlaA family lipoprotein [Paraburkholderia sp. 22099]|jgi:phospholipid-binding lipoprotein MlaA|uniref:Phospholipid-binding lipoprotein MlaA n=1 Tax=Paraburkholderia terricola TaxID=169427 RepID=A0A1M6U0M6_9BURK|nr:MULTISPECIES: VacJ family lipoprotein [Paraburkholderia]ORC45036.1 ABC transporter [Burkholderia sp. A27]AXE93730.1 ABC transporter [Paraburkholderia terricola]MDR6449166.1 phospholipid-binding lipoprotein MlaA [Paraburkholderia terricola]SDO85117.1 phospholipid-binding lipoprotein MlaA [Paraburkholderia sediminicola]SHK62703.1 phospholipid-binding lipoprotein MlaA [Paraburkholderia terricola]
MQTLRISGAGALQVAKLTVVMAALAGCTTVQTPTKGDPLEGLNRTIFTVNDKIDQYALKPVAKGYVFVTPQPVRDSVTNFFSNIGDVYIAANNLLQLKITDGVQDIMRIVINTVFGVGGLFDVATLAKLPKHDNDLGLTLGHYGVPTGPYLVLPLFGPSTLRDAVGSLGNYYVNPLSYIDPPGLSWALYGLNVVNTRANLLNASDVLEGAALDKYSFVRNAYLQRRQYLLSDGKQAQALPNYGDEAPLPKYEDVDAGAASAAGAPAGAVTGTAGTAAGTQAAPAKAAGASGTAAATPPQAASAAGATAGTTSGATGTAAKPEAASGSAETPPIDMNGGPETTQIPAGQLVPPTRFNFPSFKLR